MNRFEQTNDHSKEAATIAAYLARGLTPERVALDDDTGRPCTGSTLLGTLQQLGEQLSALLPPPGGDKARVISILPDGAPTALVLLALLDRATVVPANPKLTMQELRYLSELTDATGIAIFEEHQEGKAAAEALGLPVLRMRRIAGRHCADVMVSEKSDAVPALLGEAEPLLILSTSGSTGTPKAVPLPRASLLASSDNIARTLQLSEEDVASHVLPMFHIGALVDLLLAPLSAGGSVYFSPREPLESLLGSVARSGATWLQTVPTMLVNLLSQADDAILGEICHRLRFVRSVSADLTAALHKDAEAQLGVPIIQMYGMTETAGQIASMELPPEKRHPGSVGRVIGPEVALLDSAGNPVEKGDIGEICVSGPTVMKGYLKSPEGSGFYGHWLRSGDLGYLDINDSLVLTGRIKEQINRGGEKISPREIETALLACEGVAEAVAFAVPHPTLNEEPAAAIVAEVGSAPDAHDLRAALRDALAEHKVPRRIEIFEAFPKLGSGKVDRRAIAQRVSRKDETSSTEARSHDPAVAKIAGIWALVLSGDLPTADADFFDMGGDSLLATNLILKVERAFGRELPPGVLFNNPTFEEFAKAVLTAPISKKTSDPMLLALRRATAGWEGIRSGSHGLILGTGTISKNTPFFFCGQSTEDYRDLVDALAIDRPAYIMRSLSKLNRYAAFARLPKLPLGRLKSDRNTDRLAQVYAEEIDAIQPSGTIHIGGFCQGAVVARVLADKLSALGREVALLVVVDRFFHDPTEYPALVFWSRGNRNSGSTFFVDARRNQDAMFPKGSTIEELPTSHSGLLKGEWAERMAHSIDQHMANPPKPRGDALLPERQSASISIHCKRLARPGERFPVTVEVTNQSAKPWPRTEESGLHLACLWQDVGRHIRKVQPGWMALEQDVKPGEKVVLKGEVTCPETSKPMKLMVDMVEDGAFWFHWRTSRSCERLVLPFLPRAASTK